MYTRRHDYEREEALRARARVEPARPKAYAELAAWLCRAGRLAQAREAIQSGLAVAERPAGLHHLLGLILLSAGDAEAGLRHLERAVEQDPTRFTFARDLALAQGAAGHTVSSVATLREAVALGGEAGSDLLWLLRIGERSAAALGGRVERRPPQPARRAAIIERLVSREPDLAEALIPRKGAPGTRDRETLRATRRALGRLAAERPSHADVHFGLSLVLEQLGEVDRAIEEAETALKANPRYAEACLLAVRLYERSGRPDAAELRCRQAAELRPRWLDTHLRLGRLLREQGRPREAAEAYRRALEIDRHCSEAKRGVESVEAALAAEGNHP